MGLLLGGGEGGGIATLLLPSLRFDTCVSCCTVRLMCGSTAAVMFNDNSSTGLVLITRWLIM